MFRGQTFLDFVGAVSSPCGLRRQYSAERVIVCPYHILARRTSNTPWFCGYRRRTPFPGFEPKYKYMFDVSKKYNHEKRSSHDDSSSKNFHLCLCFVPISVFLNSDAVAKTGSHSGWWMTANDQTPWETGEPIGGFENKSTEGCCSKGP